MFTKWRCAIPAANSSPNLVDSRVDERATLLIHSKLIYRANVSESPAGRIASLEYALESFEDRFRERETDLATIPSPKDGPDETARSTFRT